MHEKCCCLKIPNPFCHMVLHAHRNFHVSEFKFVTMCGIRCSLRKPRISCPLVQYVYRRQNSLNKQLSKQVKITQYLNLSAIFKSLNENKNGHS